MCYAFWLPCPNCFLTPEEFKDSYAAPRLSQPDIVELLNRSSSTAIEADKKSYAESQDPT